MRSPNAESTTGRSNALQLVFTICQPEACRLAGHCLDPANAARDGTFGHNLEQRDVTQRVYMRAAAQLD